MNAYEIIKKPLLSEKSYEGIATKNYTFIVDKRATKTEVKQAIQEIFKVSVEKVNILNRAGKIKRMGKNEGRRPGYKKAFVNLSADSKPIEFFESLA